MEKYVFKEALPVWETCKEKEIHYNLEFRCVIPMLEKAHIALTASNLYQLFVNGKMVSEGPARAGHGYYRVDEIELSSYLTEDKNIVSIIVCSYNVKNFCYIKQDGFLCAEVVSENRVICATGKQGFEARYMSERLRKVCRYSYQRAFSESYILDESYLSFKTDADFEFDPVMLIEQSNKQFIRRDIPYPCYDFVPSQSVVSRGSVHYLAKPKDPIRDRIVVNEGSEYFCYDLDDMDIVICDEMCCIKNTSLITVNESPENVKIAADDFAIFALPSEKAGFITLELVADADAVVYLSFDEILTNGDVIRRLSTMNYVSYELKKGCYNLISIEPYAYQYMKVINKSTDHITVKRLGITEFENQIHEKPLNSGNKKLDKIYSAAVETYRQNVVDIYMDCPSRERAGWLCDSFFISRAEKALTGKSLVEKNFLENFIYNDGVDLIPDSMLPMCYPSDFVKPDLYIPQWSLWYILQIGEYYERTNDRQLINAAEEKLMALVRYFEKFENADGLLENLKGWCFVEWSHANKLVAGVNYPTNMLYAKALKTLGDLYGKGFAGKAEKIAETVREQSYDGTFFHDQAIRAYDGELSLVKDITEVCQYYAFFTGVATKEKYPQLWRIILDDFGNPKNFSDKWSEIHPANVLPGYMLRLELLGLENQKEDLLSNLEGYFYDMAVTTGTLWEYNSTRASCNHGFTSHLVVWLERFARRM